VLRRWRKASVWSLGVAGLKLFRCENGVINNRGSADDLLLLVDLFESGVVSLYGFPTGTCVAKGDARVSDDLLLPFRRYWIEEGLESKW